MNTEQIENLYMEKRDQLIKRFIYSCKGSEMDAEDIVQEAFTRLLTYKENVPSEKPAAEKYLTQIAYNCFLCNRNEERRGGAVDYDELAEDSLMREEDTHFKEVLDVIKSLDKVIVSYPEQEKEALRLHFNKGYRCSDLASLLGNSKYYWSQLTNEVHQRLVSLHERGGFFSKGKWVEI